MADEIITTAYQNINWSVNTPADIVQNVNNTAGGWLFSGIALMVFFIMLITLTGLFGFETAFLVSGFAGIVLSVILLYAGVVSYQFAGIFVGVVGAIIMYIIWSNQND